MTNFLFVRQKCNSKLSRSAGKFSEFGIGPSYADYSALAFDTRVNWLACMVAHICRPPDATCLLRRGAAADSFCLEVVQLFDVVLQALQRDQPGSYICANLWPSVLLQVQGTDLTDLC